MPDAPVRQAPLVEHCGNETAIAAAYARPATPMHPRLIEAEMSVFLSRSDDAMNRGTGLMKRRAFRAVLVLVLGIGLLTTGLSQATLVAPLNTEAVAAVAGVKVAAQPPGEIVDSAPGFGWTQGQFSVSDDGAAQYNLPLWAPDARGGKVAPKLALSFDSRGGNGLVGVGWSLSGLSSISWCPRTYAQDGFGEGAHFDGRSALCLGGMRLLPTTPPLSQPEREYVTEHQSFARIVAYGMQDHVPDYFKVWTKDGMIQTFGQTDNARLEAYRLQRGANADDPLVRAPGGRVPLAWAVNKVEDRNGNAATVEYLRGEGDEDELSWVEMRPSAIEYEPNRRVEFAYESRIDEDPIESFGGGVQTRIAHRLKTVSMYAGPGEGTSELVREYQLDYANNSITGRSLLEEISECDGKHVCKAPLPLSWTKGSYEFKEIVEQGTTESMPAGFLSGDVNGDGADDMIYRLADPNDDEPEKLVVRAGSKNGRQFGFPHEIEFPDGELGQIRPVDVDVDGKTELMVRLPDSSEVDGYRRNIWTLYESDGLDFEPAPNGRLDDYKNSLDGSFRFADLDGNGLPDFVAEHREPASNADFWFHRLNTGAGGSGRFAEPVEADVPDSISLGGASVGDMDGDGRGEITSDTRGWGLKSPRCRGEDAQRSSRER